MPLEETVPVKYLLTVNPCYHPHKMAIADALYYGGDCFEKMKCHLLYKRAADKNQKYRDSREQSAEYTDYIAGIMDFFIATTMQSPPKIVFSISDDSVERLIEKVHEQSAKL